MTHGIGQSNASGDNIIGRPPITIEFKSSNCDSLPNERLSFAYHFREIYAYNNSIDLINSFKKASPDSEDSKSILEQLLQQKSYIKELIVYAEMRVADNCRRNTKTEVSDQNRLRDLRNILDAISKAAPELHNNDQD
ncbi:hypothetical protein [Pseudochelatococcus sp. G4_1912]|uniref:hypothetical protein n=1 Tax=Pseudochelatococcus sp. G4_1912 TaxID=3114288 RepID=UPI0039C74176